MRYAIRYDFEEMVSIINRMKNGKVDSHTLNELKKEVNSFFKDSTCRDIIYTENTDKLFFGMAVFPVISGDQAVEIIQTDSPYRITEYYLEIDSKLFSDTLNMKPNEIVAILLHEIGHVVNDNKPVEEVRKSIDLYLMDNNETLVLSDSVHYREILAYGIKDTIRKLCSMFEYKDEEMLADEFVVACGFGEELHTAFEKILKHSFNINSKVDNKLIVLCWVLRLYKDIKMRRIPALKQLNRGKQLSSSKLEKRELENVIRRLNRIDDDSLLESAGNTIRDKYSAAVKNIKYKGIRSLEDDLYEYRMRIRNVEDEEDALYLLRGINTRLAIIDDYIMTEQLGEAEQKRWFDLEDSFSKLRDELSKKSIYRNKQFGIVVQYPDIVPNRV